MGKRDKARLSRVTVRLPFGIGEVEWESDTTERRAAWELYVELVTRVAVQPMAGGEGLLSEALSSLSHLFPTTREILRAAGPGVGAGNDTVGGIAIAVLNRGLRPFLARWHPLVQAWEAERPAGISPSEHEQKWPRELREQLAEVRAALAEYATALAVLAGVSE